MVIYIPVSRFRFMDFPESFPIFRNMFLILDFPAVEELDSSDVLFTLFSFSRFLALGPFSFSTRTNMNKLIQEKYSGIIYNLYLLIQYHTHKQDSTWMGSVSIWFISHLIIKYLTSVFNILDKVGKTILIDFGRFIKCTTNSCFNIMLPYCNLPSHHHPQSNHRSLCW